MNKCERKPKRQSRIDNPDTQNEGKQNKEQNTSNTDTTIKAREESYKDTHRFTHTV